MGQESLKLYWWRMDYPKRGNFGDEITRALIVDIFGIPCEWAGPDQCDLAGAGSIIEFLAETRNKNRPAIWGSGFMRPGESVISSNEFRICAVRGRLSKRRAVTSETTVAVGDPGLLASLLLRGEPKKKYGLGVLPHFLDAELPLVRQLSTRQDVKIIDATAEPAQVVSEVAECSALLSSSLHGLIVADSLGVPNAHLRLSKNELIGHWHKFMDYYSAFENPDRHVVLEPSNIEANEVPDIIDHVISSFHPPIGIDVMKDALLKSFPFPTSRNELYA